MSIVPISDDQFDSFSLDLWSPFVDFPLPSMLSSQFSQMGILPSTQTQTQIGWSETRRYHVFRAYLPGEDALVYIDDDRMLNISTESDKFSGKFKLPENAITNQIEAKMDNNGVLVVTIAKQGNMQMPNVRSIEIQGE